jgi:hypothetical protein
VREGVSRGAAGRTDDALPRCDVQQVVELVDVDGGSGGEQVDVEDVTQRARIVQDYDASPSM